MISMSQRRPRAMAHTRRARRATRSGGIDKTSDSVAPFAGFTEMTSWSLWTSMRETSLVSVARSILICSLSPLGSLSLAKCCQGSIEANAPARRWISSAKDSATAIFEDAHFARALLNRMVDQRLADRDMRGPALTRRV